MIGAVYAFYHITDKRMDKMEQHHREDMKLIREDMQKMDEKFERMDLKWERLFERLLIQDQQKGGHANKAT
jgi:hypothetical protein